MPITLQDAIARTLASPALADTAFAAEYRAATGHTLADDASRIAHQVLNELRQIPADDAPPNAYEKHLATLRASQPTTSSTFEDRYKEMRYASLAVEQVQLDADAADEIRALAAHRSDLSALAAPWPLASLQEGHYNLVVERRIVDMHHMPCVRYHHLGFTLEAAFEFRRDEEEHRRASVSRHQERRELQLPPNPHSRGEA